MELYKNSFKSLEDYNDFVNITLINEGLLITPISVVPQTNGYVIFYTKTEL